MTPDMTKGPKFRILLAEDHDLIRQVLRATLESYPNLLIVGEAVNGKDAVCMAAALKPHGIIMDINMPRMDGIQATKHIKTAQPAIRIIGLSIINDIHVADAMKMAGAEAVLLKDDLNKLYDVMQSWSADASRAAHFQDGQDPEQSGTIGDRGPGVLNK
jgi:DNA-binding NarL/FixJ family response regulator